MEIFHLIFRPEVMVFMIPISAIVGGVYLSSLKVKAKMMTSSLNNEERKMLGQVMQENQELKERLANLEDIVTSIDQEALDFSRNAPRPLPQSRSSAEEGKKPMPD